LAALAAVVGAKELHGALLDAKAEARAAVQAAVTFDAGVHRELCVCLQLTLANAGV
jgi:hypothetical protein